MADRGSNGKGLDATSLKLKVVARFGDPKVLAKVMKFYLGVEDLNTKNCVLDGLELFGFTKRLTSHLVSNATHIDLTK